MPSCYAVYEWWPQNWTVINNFPVSFGDTVLGLICLQSPTDAYVNLVNLTMGFRTGFDITPPAGTMSAENQIEWVFEHPGVGGASPQLPKFGEIYFDSAMGGRGLDYLADAGTDTVINMVQNNVTVATTTYCTVPIWVTSPVPSIPIQANEYQLPWPLVGGPTSGTFHSP